MPGRVEETRVRLRVGAAIAGEGTPNAFLLLAAAESYEQGCHGDQDLPESALRDYQALILHPETTGEMIEVVARLCSGLSDELRQEFCGQLLAADEDAARRFIDQLDAQVGRSTSSLAEPQPTVGG